MLSALAAWRKLRSLPDALALKVLDELSRERVYEAERIIHDAWGTERAAEADELVSSLVRAGLSGELKGILS